MTSKMPVSANSLISDSVFDVDNLGWIVTSVENQEFKIVRRGSLSNVSVFRIESDEDAFKLQISNYEDGFIYVNQFDDVEFNDVVRFSSFSIIGDAGVKFRFLGF